MNAEIENQLKETAKFLASKTKLKPKLGFVLGSGLSGFAKKVKAEVTIPFGEIPNFTSASVEGHPGKLLIGTLNGVPVAVMLGRLHPYEGLTMQQVVYPIRTLAVFGIKTLVVTNAAGGLSTKMKPGDLMIIKDHINLTGDNPLRGANVNLGPRFVDLTEPYDKFLRKALKIAAKKEKVKIHEGVYVGVLGPTYETASEVRFYAKIGGGSVGMSTVAEVIAARHAGLKVAGVSCVTNLATGLAKEKLNHEDVKLVAAKSEDRFSRLLTSFTAQIQSDL